MNENDAIAVIAAVWGVVKLTQATYTYLKTRKTAAKGTQP